jgi:MoaA/NifB/PqqE/SkfB family radical SAM enzyme
MTKLRSDLYHGIKNQNCNNCWQNEETGKESLRLNYNNLFRKYVNFKDIINSSKNKFLVKELPTTWDLRLGNLCNIKCVMCTPEFSNKIEQEVNENIKLINEKFPLKISAINSNVNWSDTDQAVAFFNEIKPTLRWLKLQGGEPLVVKSVRSLIESLDKQQTTLAVTTNGTVLDDKLYKGIANLDRVEFSISVEAVGSANDIIRYGSEWNVIKKNILKLKKLANVDIQINHVLQITSVFYLVDVIRFCEEHDLHLMIGMLEDPNYLSLSACPQNYLTKLVDDVYNIDIKHKKNQYIKEFITNTVNSTQFKEQLWDDFKGYTMLLDELRPNKYSSILKFESLK